MQRQRTLHPSGKVDHGELRTIHLMVRTYSNAMKTEEEEHCHTHPRMQCGAPNASMTHSHRRIDVYMLISPVNNLISLGGLTIFFHMPSLIAMPYHFSSIVPCLTSWRVAHVCILYPCPCLKTRRHSPVHNIVRKPMLTDPFARPAPFARSLCQKGTSAANAAP
jgi:hypothetical protein